MAEKSDTNGDSHNNGKYAMYINVSQPADDHAKGIKPGENLNPVKTLRMRYNAWVKAGSKRTAAPPPTLFTSDK